MTTRDAKYETVFDFKLSLNIRTKNSTLASPHSFLVPLWVLFLSLFWSFTLFFGAGEPIFIRLVHDTAAASANARAA